MILSQKLNVFELIVLTVADEIKQITYIGNKLIELCAIQYQWYYDYQDWLVNVTRLYELNELLI